MSQTHTPQHTGKFLAISLSAEDSLFVISRPTNSRNPQEVAEMLAKECGDSPDRILLVQNGERPDGENCSPEVVEDWNHGKDFNDAI
jgi:hypothetical protein